MSEELKQLRETMEVKAKTFDREKWGSRTELWDVKHFSYQAEDIEAELPNSNNISITDSIRGEGRGIGGLLRGDFVKRGEFLYWQGKIIEHTAWHKEQAKKKAEKNKSIWTNDGHGMDKV